MAGIATAILAEHTREEQEMEAEALEAIFPDAFEILRDEPPFRWAVRLVPVDTGGDEEEEERLNHVAVRVVATLPSTYPEQDPPELEVEIVKGLADDQRKEILQIAEAEAEANAGMPAVFTVCEAVRTWLADNNVKGQDDGSMYAQMMRKAKEAERSKAQAEMKFEAQKKLDELTEAELEEQAVRRRREEGTPCTEDNFVAWKEKFDAEMADKAAAEKELAERESSKKKERKDVDTSGRLTGFEQFSGKAGVMNLEAIEAAATLESGVEGLDVNEELFEDDDDLDDLDFEEDDSGDDYGDTDDDDEEPDI